MYVNYLYNIFLYYSIRLYAYFDLINYYINSIIYIFLYLEIER